MSDAVLRLCRRIICKKEPLSRFLFSTLERGCHDGFDGVHTVFGFVENDGLFAFKDFIGDFHAVDSELVMNLLTDKWISTIPLLQLLCISGAFVPITNLYQQLLISRGRSDLYMWGVICEGILILICLILASPYGVVTMLKAYVTLYICYVAVWYGLTYKTID